MLQRLCTRFAELGMLTPVAITLICKLLCACLLLASDYMHVVTHPAPCLMLVQQSWQQPTAGPAASFLWQPAMAHRAAAVRQQVSLQQQQQQQQQYCNT
jgi:hypothetical protein